MDLFDILLARKLGGGGGGGSLTTYIDGTFTPTEAIPDNLYEYIFSDISIPEGTTPIYVTFDGVDYTVPYDADYGAYGAQYDESLGGFDWSTYPFTISSDVGDNSILVGTETGVEHSVIIKGEGGGGSSITVESLYVNSNDTYEAPEGTAYSPVVVEVTPSRNVVFTGTLTVNLGNNTASIVEVVYANPIQGDIKSIRLTSQSVMHSQTFSKINDLFIMIQPVNRNKKVTVTNRSSGIVYYVVELTDRKGIIVRAQDSDDTITVITERI